MFSVILLFALTRLLLVLGAPAASQDDLRRSSLKARQDRQETLPVVKLPYVSQRAYSYDPLRDIYVFKNIRFADPPVGKLRFAKPAPPSNITEIQYGTNGGSCIQSFPAGLVSGMIGEDLGSLVAGFMGGVDLGKAMGGSQEQEDCLFLDVVVPGRALRGEVKLPVLNWVYGGSYILGNKDGMYEGTPLVKASKGNFIYVAGNYRLGSLGFLAGATMEKEESATTNVGFYDQRAVLEWIQKYIHLFGGDPGAVTIMGESAGAGSITFHLTAFGGTQNPLFKRAIIQSPGYSVHTWDRKGINEETYKTFLAEAGCSGKGIDCLRNVPFRKVKFAQDETIKRAVEGTFGFGPVVDGKWIRQLPQLELISGNHWKDLDSLIVTHVSDEANLFTRRDRVYNDTNFKAYLNWSYGNNSAVTESLMKYYELDKYQDGRSRLMDYTMHSSFTCTTRNLAQAYPNITYMAQFEGMHGSDVAADFFDNTSTSGKLSSFFSGSNANEKYQLYLISFAQSGSPNKFKSADTPDWEKIKFGDVIENVLEVTGRFRLIRDFQTAKPDCDVLANAYAATSEVGLSPPGSVVKSDLVDIDSK